MKILPVNGEGLSLVGFRISPAREGPQLFSIIVYNGKDSPIIIDGQIAFIDKPEHTTVLYELCSSRLKALGPPPTEVDLICDVPRAIEIIRRKKRDNKAIILNCLNTLFDLLDAVNARIPDEYKGILYPLADHLTFNREFGSFINEAKINRDLIVNAIMWCVGAVAVNSRIMS
jgi:hypothetical protein